MNAVIVSIQSLLFNDFLKDFFCCCRAVEDLLKYLDPQFTDHITLPDAMKLEFILAGKNLEGPGGKKQMSV